MKYKLYYLVDPESREIRYVGVTKQKLQQRLSAHICEPFCKTRKISNHKTNWISSLVNKGLKPEINLLQTFNTEADVFAAEIYWIGYFTEAGCALTNNCAGGKGTLNPSKETRKKMSDAKAGRPSPKKGIPTGTSSRRRSILCITNNTIYTSLAEAAEILDINRPSISNVLSGKRNHTGGFRFQYLQEAS